MKFVKPLLAAVALAASLGAHASVTGQLGGGYGSFLSLSGTPGATCTGASGASPCTLGTIGSIVGGKEFVSDKPFADIPKGGVFGGAFLTAGASSNNDEPATLTFGTGVSYLSFLWGSPDTYNTLSILTSDGISTLFSAAGLGFAVTNGNQSFSQYVQFFASAGTTITKLIFSNDPKVDAFEVANFSVTPIPEPETYALIMAGLGALWFITRRRKNGMI